MEVPEKRRQIAACTIGSVAITVNSQIDSCRCEDANEDSIIER